jgi:hypothetical protein
MPMLPTYSCKVKLDLTSIEARIANTLSAYTAHASLALVLGTLLLRNVGELKTMHIRWCIVQIKLVLLVVFCLINLICTWRVALR